MCTEPASSLPVHVHAPCRMMMNAQVVRSLKQENKPMRIFHIVINLYFRLPLPAVRIWHLVGMTGCQRVTEPVLSPLLYKSITVQGTT